MSLTGKAAIVTGAAKGIGRATALAFAAAGAGVCAVDLSESVTSAVDQIRSSGGRGTSVVGDISKAQVAEEAVAETVREFGGVNVLVNNAAVVVNGTVLEVAEEDWDRCMAVNVKSIYLLSRHAIPHMAQAGGGVVLNMSSITGLVGKDGRPAYCASKGAVIALTRAMAVDHAELGVRAIAICPSGIKTDQMEAMFRESPDPEQSRRETIARHPIGRMADPNEVADLLVFLASDKASFVTGSVYTFDGGFTAV